MFLLQKIEELMMEYHDARYAVGEFVLHEQSNLHKYTINQIAEYSYTSKATVVRFAKTLGFDGWKEFMKAFISEMKYLEQHKADADVNYPFDAKSSVNEIIDSIKKVQIESIQDSADLLDVEMLEKAVHYLIKAKHIIIFGLSPNIFIGELFRRKMITIKKQVDIAKLGEMGIISNTLTEDDCAIMISYSGNNEHAEPMCYIPTLLENKVSVIGITSGGDNYMRKELDCVLTMSSKERLYTKISNFATEESLQYIFNVLFSCYFAKHYQDNNLYKLQNSKILESSRWAVLKSMKDE
ncbi:MurR/RpiR family transcriptional regulator [Eubacterium sp. AM18-26]|uniref:RpiR family transcriptional regulator n=1 Tax=Amedibacterium intestinale TaxID=2583452 RepID=A0A6N4TG68_9FIRM|nr:MurR/RpiR family transcriptional regulator [Eubacterium sp. AM18-26]RHO25223.1 MurR/RpiR family transcriptional regulator [Eubacterium sp. AM18-10LB-B]BBK21980.1 RpiR family transcriptional regulator [Amedibacterium intestinale]BBK62062.1 RpiR family transcriptional regulator [Amedibacterium intestinale]